MRCLGRALVVGLLVCVAAARSEDRKRTPPAPQPPDAGSPRPPLSVEDLELLKELPLLERLDLLRNLELFEPEDAGPAKEPKG